MTFWSSDWGSLQSLKEIFCPKGEVSHPIAPMIPKIAEYTCYIEAIDAKDNDQNTPLHIAIQHNNPNSVEALLKLGVDINQRNNDDQTPLDIAQSQNTQDIIETLETYEAKTSKEIDVIATEKKISHGTEEKIGFPDIDSPGPEGDEKTVIGAWSECYVDP